MVCTSIRSVWFLGLIVVTDGSRHPSPVCRSNLEAKESLELEIVSHAPFEEDFDHMAMTADGPLVFLQLSQITTVRLWSLRSWAKIIGQIAPNVYLNAKESGIIRKQGRICLQILDYLRIRPICAETYAGVL